MKAFKLALIFFTRIPISTESFDIELLAKHFYLVVLVGYIFGILGLFISLLFSFLPPILLATLIIFLVEYLNGFQHLDGLLDVGDALMACKSKEEKIKILKDTRLGTGAFIYGFFYLAFSIFSLSYILKINIFYILIVEVLSRLSLLTTAVFGAPMKESSAKLFIKKSDIKHLTLGLILTFPLLFLANGRIVAILILSSIIIGIFVSYLGKKEFGGINGDVLGFSNQVGRAFLYLLLTFIYSFKLTNLL
ncbi:cobalamin 5'-phosphate synthase [Methanocaldococcus infernus ME]|uniref:Adenosylcobinamide-GDP ribazoletransferase n=1 Tax=Methanocaldococcus infernus (strain DSM 11812 / JCM 15783 / ME) TaxID=573063 RepID=D5VSB6_METIM|nr:adenosylcobinamide-GDP ribazoletransferase [Methanocaldococcus infernus]ADG13469.1 cobalamin 5'-phosphate synthase [Methanocaldococcus infernus ME]